MIGNGYFQILSKFQKHLVVVLVFRSPLDSEA